MVCILGPEDGTALNSDQQIHSDGTRNPTQAFGVRVQHRFYQPLFASVHPLLTHVLVDD